MRRDIGVEDDKYQKSLVGLRKNGKNALIIPRLSEGCDIQHALPTDLHSVIVAIAGEPRLS